MIKIFLLILFHLQAVTGNIPEEKSFPTKHFNSYPVGELGRQWTFPSDHLPVGGKISESYFACWNILNKDYLHWIESNTQGLKESLIMEENIEIEGKQGLTVRENHIIGYVVEMLTHPTHPRSLIGLEETNVSVIKALSKILPPHFKMVTADENIFIYNSDHLSPISYESGYYTNLSNTWMSLTLQEKKSGKSILFILSHAPGGPKCEHYLNELAEVVVRKHNPANFTVVMGDQNRPPGAFQLSLQLAKLKHKKDYLFAHFCIAYPTHINTHREASWIDNVFVSAPSVQDWENCSVCQTGESFFQDLAQAIELLQTLACAKLNLNDYTKRK